MNGARHRQRAERPPGERFAPKKMVEWYNPLQLLVTGLQVIVWEFVGQGRPMEEQPRSFTIFDCGNEEVWFDFAADLGDGWNPTFAIASLIAQPSLEVAGRALPRGAFLLLGGDQVYPMPTQREYRDRFVQPYTAALPDGGPAQRPLFAIPGNHDWYDGLVSFTRQFTQHRSFGGWTTFQHQSYFAIQLPQRWWLWAMDVRTGTHMDYGQQTYFRRAARELRPDDRVILVAAESDWVTLGPDSRDESHFWRIEEDLITPAGATVYLWLAGDLHHYRRHELRKPDGTTDCRFQRITSGGGGAFLCPTHRPVRRNFVVERGRPHDSPPDVAHRPDADRVGVPRAVPRVRPPRPRKGRDAGVVLEEFVQKTRFPSAVTSFRLSWLNLLLAGKNWKLALFPFGVLYWLVSWVPTAIGGAPVESWTAPFGSPGMLLWLFTILFGFAVFADRERRWFRWIGGLAHGIAHVVTAIGVTGVINASFLVGAVSPTDYIAAHALNFLAGVVFGPTVLGLYLLLSLNLFGFHSLEAFSSLRVQDYKHFLRFHVDLDGRLEIFPIAIRKVPRHGEARARYMLIEEPVVIDPAEDARVDRPLPAVEFFTRA